MSDVWIFAITVTVIGYAIVLLALVFLSVIYRTIPKVINFFVTKRLKKKGRSVEKVGDPTHTGEVNAAIALAIHLYMSEQHDFESGKVTVEHKSQHYSPWSSKIYSIRGNLNSRI